MTTKKLLMLGFGNCAKYVHDCPSPYDIKYATTRDLRKSQDLSGERINSIYISDLKEQGLEIIQAASDADVLVSFPPDSSSDQFLSSLIGRKARKVIYISSTSLYGSLSGRIDDQTEIELSSERSQVRRNAELAWLNNCSAIVLRAPALYGGTYGLHKRLIEGKYKIPGDGSKFVSRIHLEDLARIILKVFEVELPSDTYVVGDLEPASQFVVVSWLCKEMNIDLPESVDIESVHATLRGDRQIDSSNLLSKLDLELLYPSFRNGFKQCLESLRS